MSNDMGMGDMDMGTAADTRIRSSATGRWSLLLKE
jgi:hypothetical protein